MSESRSDTDWRRARELLAYGGQHRMLVRPLYEGEDAVFPRFAAHASGYEIVDSEGRAFVDWMNGWGPVLLGYRHPRVEAAIRDQLEAGPMLSLMHPVELDVASSLVEMVPCAEMVAFGKNGSDALTGAVRAARAYTRREIVLHHGYHGFHDWYVSRAAHAPGIPGAWGETIHDFPYNDLDALSAVLDRFAGQVAAVLMEPTNIRLPEPGYLEGVRELAHEHGALLIFDEVVTGFRLANGGAQELFGVTPDLACFGKGIANGMPLSVIAGQGRFMRYLPSVSYGMTFRGETLSLAAARTVLETLREEPVTEHLAHVGRQVRTAFAELSEQAGVACELLGPDARMSFVFVPAGGLGPEAILTLFLRECARNGVLTNGTLFPSYAHDDEAVRRTVAAFAAALETVAETARTGSAEVNGDGPPVLSSRAFVEAMSETDGGLLVKGWLLVDERSVDSIELVPASGETLVAEALERADVAAAFPLAKGTERCGFSALLPSEAFARGGDWQFELRALRGQRVVFRCPVTRPVGLPVAAGPHEATPAGVHA